MSVDTSIGYEFKMLFMNFSVKGYSVVTSLIELLVAFCDFANPNCYSLYIYIYIYIVLQPGKAGVEYE